MGLCSGCHALEAEVEEKEEEVEEVEEEDAEEDEEASQISGYTLHRTCTGLRIARTVSQDSAWNQAMSKMEQKMRL